MILHELLHSRIARECEYSSSEYALGVALVRYSGVERKQVLICIRSVLYTTQVLCCDKYKCGAAVNMHELRSLLSGDSKVSSVHDGVAIEFGQPTCICSKPTFVYI